MNTFLPYPDFELCARCLDYRRLGNQRKETLQILQSLLGISSGWKNHPCVKMWSGYELNLCQYGIAMCKEWISKGYKDTCLPRFIEYRRILSGHNVLTVHFLGNEEFHRSHRSNLMRKLPEYYAQFNWDVSDDLPYIWPLPRHELTGIVL